MGIAGFIGTLLITTVLNARFYPTLVAIPLLMAAIAGTLLLAGHHTGSVAVPLSLWGLLATAAPTGWWTWIGADAARGCGDGRRADGRRDPAIDSPRVNGRRPGV